ncbi:MAG: hypothetical protein WB780_17595 [Candidatus Acidiferrales bacterium]
MDHAGAQISSTLLAVSTMQWLKNSPWFPLLKKGQVAMNRLVSIIVAGGIAAGIHFTVVGSVTAGGTFTGTFPSLWVMAIGLEHWAAQYIYQETGYRALDGLQSLSGILAHLQTLPAAGPQQPAPAPVPEPAPKV